MLSSDHELLAKEIASLVQRLRLWTPARWSAAADPWGTRADLVRHLAQWLADQAAVLGGESQRRLPVLGLDLLVPDQLAVTGDDFLRAALEMDTSRAAPDQVTCRAAVDHVLTHRLDLMGEPAPPSLGGESAVRRGREVCLASLTNR